MSKVFIAISLISVIAPIVIHGVLNPNLDGPIIAYVLTPYNDKGEVNLGVVPQYAEYLAKRNIKNLYIMGFFGEGPSLPLHDRKSLTMAWVKETNRLGLNLIVQVGAMPFFDQVELAKFCSHINVSAIAAFPYLVFEAKTKDELIEDYQRLSDAAPNLPLLYDTLTITDPKIYPDQAFITLMGRVKTFAGAIVTTDRALDVTAAVPSIDGYQIWIFGNRAIASTIILKFNGTLTNGVNLCPKLVLTIEALIKAKKIDQALHLQQQKNRLVQAFSSNNDAVFVNNNRTYFKYVRATFRLFSGIDLGARLPFEKANSAELEAIRCNLREFEDLINCYCT